MQAHYGPRANTGDRVTLEGVLDVSVSPFVRLLSRLTGMLVPYSGQRVPVTVTLRSNPGSSGLEFDRVFHYPHRGDVRFRSRMEVVRENQLVEIMRFGIGWRFVCDWDDMNITLRHRGYVWRIFGILMPLPLGLALGNGVAGETPMSDSEFRMWTHARHPW